MSERVMPALVEGSSRLKQLSINFLGNSLPIDIEQVCLMESLERFQISLSCLTDEKLSTILNGCKLLKYLAIDNNCNHQRSNMLTSAAFLTKPIMAPLECVLISVTDAFINDTALLAFKQCSQTLKQISLDENYLITNDGVATLIDNCPKLFFLSLSRTLIDETILEKMFCMRERHFETVCISCDKLNVAKFLDDKPGQFERTFIFTDERNRIDYFEYQMRNIQFAVSLEGSKPDYMEMHSSSDEEDEFIDYYRLNYHLRNALGVSF